MRIVVIGGTGQIGSKVVSKLEHLGHSVLAASTRSGVNIISGQGLEQALAGADVVVDATNTITMDRQASIDFFETATRNLLAAEASAGVHHHVALSVLNSASLSQSGYIAGKLAQERCIDAGAISYTLVRATQFFELVPVMIQMGTINGVVRLSHARFQPIAAQDVADTLVETAISAPHDGAIEICGPDIFRIDELAERFIRATGRQIRVETDPDGTYFGAPLRDDTLLPSPAVLINPTTFDEWLDSQAARIAI